MAGKRFAQDFARIDEVEANDAILVQDGDDGIVKFANPSQLLEYINNHGGYATAEGLSAAQQTLNAKIDTKQDELVSGENIRTVAGKNIVGEGNVVITKADVGLENVDNTSDANKPISNATQQALNTLTTAVGQRVESTTFEQYQAEQEEALDGKQDTLSLSVLNNGNIRIGNLAGQTKDFMPATPSGDPWHYAYEAVGATWNATTEFWELNGVNDIDNTQMRSIYIVTNPLYDAVVVPYGFANSNIRTNIPNRGSMQLTHYAADKDARGLFRNCSALEVVNLKTTLPTQAIASANMQELFRYCPLLKDAGYWDFTYTTTTNVAFQGCTALEEVRIYGLKTNISFEDSPNLSYDSILYLIENSQAVPIVITLHPTAYENLSSTDIFTIISEQYDYITLASA